MKNLDNYNSIQLAAVQAALNAGIVRKMLKELILI